MTLTNHSDFKRIQTLPQKVQALQYCAASHSRSHITDSSVTTYANKAPFHNDMYGNTLTSTSDSSKSHRLSSIAMSQPVTPFFMTAFNINLHSLEDTLNNCAQLLFEISRKKKTNTHPLFTSSSLFQKLNRDHLVEHRHKNSVLQHEYDKQFGLVLHRG